MSVYNDDDLFIEPASDEDVVYGSTMEEGIGNSTGDSFTQRPYIRLTSQLRNVTREAGKEMRMRCEAMGTPPITFSWMKNYAPLEKSRRVKIRHKESASRLVITDLDVLDSGYYQCIASNSAASVNSTAILRVKNAPEKAVKSRPQVSRIPSTDSEEYDDYESSLMENPLGRLPSDEENDLYQVPDSAAGPGFVPVGPSERWLDEQKVKAGQCVLYRGEACRPFLAGRHIKITSDNREDMYDIDRNLRAAIMFINNSPTISIDCKRISHSVACFHMYKVCDMRNGMEGGRLQAICRADCEKLTSEVCPSEVALAAEHDLVGDGPRALFPSCSVLAPTTDSCIPVLRESTSSQSPQEKADMNWLPRHDHWCYSDSGRRYLGLVSETASGKPCLDWLRSPSREFSTLRYEELRHAKNYCRNPGGRKPRPWCYASPHGQEEYCEVPLCPPGINHHGIDGKGAKAEGGSEAGGPMAFWLGLSPAWQLGLVSGSVLSLLLLLLLCCACCCRRKPAQIGKGRATNGGSQPPLPSCSVPQSVVNSVSNSTYYRKLNGTSTPCGGVLPGRMGGMTVAGGCATGVEMSSLLGGGGRMPPPYEHEPFHVLEIASSQLQFNQPLGEGQFGVLSSAVWTGSPSGPIPVAVKSIRHDSTNASRASLEEEVGRIASFDHPHVLRLLGISYLEDTRFSAVFEYSVNGDLHELLSIRSIHCVSGEDAAAEAARLAADANDFTLIATQIACGMEYLAGHGYIHRDLATRNILVGEHRNIKIADFAMMRATYENDYYKPLHRTWMPVRWMSREAVEQARFSEKSDVWAFGVTLWEIFSYGKQPYEGYSNQQVLELVASRHLLECPPQCPTSIYSLMVECWHEMAERRPSFSELACRLQTWSTTSPAHSLLHSIPPRASSSSHSGSSAGRMAGAMGAPRGRNMAPGFSAAAGGGSQLMRPPPAGGVAPRKRPDDSSPLMRERGQAYQYSDDDIDSD